MPILSRALMTNTYVGGDVIKSNAANKCVISGEDTDKDCTVFNSTPASDTSHNKAI